MKNEWGRHLLRSLHMSFCNNQLQKDAIKTHHSNLRSPIPEPGSSARLSLIQASRICYWKHNWLQKQTGQKGTFSSL
ncbi:hypothetical protein ABFV80_001833 [Vandammella animalimorsus]|uniref:hypothetical protein n=1 Tax=Vandammella animalimorsus TaxID=2029117 RepID=UPI00325ADCA8